MSNTTRQVNEKPRFFYTDPLAAAWMAKTYGMQFSRSKGEGVYAHRTLCDWDWNHNTHKPARFYIHPDSLTLLNPQVGDIVSVGSLALAADGSGQAWLDQNGPYGVWIEFEGGFFGIDDTALTWNPASKIIQRDGKPFFWPLREGDHLSLRRVTKEEV
jgi:hypothetical protein